MDELYYKKFEPFWGSWYIKRFIGEGSFGKCYEIEKRDITGTYSAALKVITVPQHKDHIQSISSTGMSADDVSGYFEDIARDVATEFKLMEKFKGTTNIVSYEDHEIRKHDDGIGCDIYIRMELLTPLSEYFAAHPPTEKDIIKLGIDISRALEICAKNKIIHRDVKPSNIFISPNGDYKLGDFGVARRIEATCGEFSKKGTYDYMAPEVYRDATYDTRADIFSLGIVLYKLMNGGRIPFLPPAPARISYNDNENAIARRMKNETPPPPQNAGAAFASVILKACQSDVNQRFSSATELREALEKASLSLPDKPEKSPAKPSDASAEKKAALLPNSAPQTPPPTADEETVLSAHPDSEKQEADTDAEETVLLTADAPAKQNDAEETVLLTPTPPQEPARSEETVLLENDASAKPHTTDAPQPPVPPKSARPTSAKKSRKPFIFAAIFAAIVVAAAVTALILSRPNASTPTFVSLSVDEHWKVASYEDTYPFYAILAEHDENGQPTGNTKVSKDITKYGAYGKLYLQKNDQTGELFHILYVVGKPTDYFEPVDEMGDEEWLISGYDTNFAEYAVQYRHGQPTDQTELTGKILKHEYFVRFADDGTPERVLYLENRPTELVEKLSTVADGSWVVYKGVYAPETYAELAVRYTDGQPDFSVCRPTGRILDTVWYTFRNNTTGKYTRVLYVNGHRSNQKSAEFDYLSDDEWVVDGYNLTDYREYANHYIDGNATGEARYTGETLDVEEWREESDGAYRYERKFVKGIATDEIRGRTAIAPKTPSAPTSSPASSAQTDTSHDIIYPSFPSQTQPSAPAQTPSQTPAPTPTPAPEQTPPAFDEVVKSIKRETLGDQNKLIGYYNAAGQLVKQEQWVLDVENKQWNIRVVDHNGNIISQSTQPAVITTDRKGNISAD